VFATNVRTRPRRSRPTRWTSPTSRVGSDWNHRGHDPRTSRGISRCAVRISSPVGPFRRGTARDGASISTHRDGSCLGSPTAVMRVGQAWMLDTAHRLRRRVLTPHAGQRQVVRELGVSPRYLCGSLCRSPLFVAVAVGQAGHLLPVGAARGPTPFRGQAIRDTVVSRQSATRFSTEESGIGNSRGGT